MQRYLETQDYRIKMLENELALMKTKLAELQNKPAVNVEKIEYKFDQLKVETLEGTLNIGLNPSDLSNIEELAINSANPPLQPYVFPNRQQFVEDVSASIAAEMDELIQDTAEQQRENLDPSFHQLIKSDIEKQLSQRVSLYLDQTSQTERSPHLLEQVKEKISERIKSDITQSIRNFIQSSSNTTGGNS
ncbi:spore germination protein GerPC [Peribacillus sp. FSL H8-0477]|uniref:spore germination protein GerPC n=1 Tax=Peribacillus sp. FSL H8-0477 TaxID=2921388 RepID=UPI0030F80FCD